MPSAFTPEEVLFPLSAEEGSVYVSMGGTFYTKPQINADTIKEKSCNNYIVEQVERLRSLLFTDKVVISVLDEQGENNVRLAQRIQKMVDSPQVNLWASMQQGWVDSFKWGCALFNPVWGRKGSEVFLEKLRRLPPESFANAPKKAGSIQSEILEGIMLNEAGFMEYWQRQSNGQIIKLENITMIKDPMSTEIAGTSKIIPVIGIISMLDFSWQAQIQKVNRIGAPIMFIQVTNPVKNNNRDDIAFAQAILKNWGKNTAYALRENMTLIEHKGKDSQSAIETIDNLAVRIRDYFSPSTLIKQDGQTLGSNGASALNLVNEWIKGIHRWIEDEFEAILNLYLEYNGYTGYRIEINIPEPEADMAAVDMQRATAGYTTQSLDKNEIRMLLGQSEANEEQLAAIAEMYKASAPPPSMSPFGFQGKQMPPGPDPAELPKPVVSNKDAKAESVVVKEKEDKTLHSHLDKGYSDYLDAMIDSLPDDDLDGENE